MSMAHPLPGGGRRKVARHRQQMGRVASAPPDIIRLRQMLRPFELAKINKIRQDAKESWKCELDREKSSVTSYNGSHSLKLLDEPTQTRLRPSSPRRQNNPHPQNVFLVTRLKKVKGCFDVDEATVRKCRGDEKTRLNEFVSSHESEIRRAMGKLPNRPNTSVVTEKEMSAVIGQVPARAAEAWIKLSSDKDKQAISKRFRETESRIKFELDASEAKFAKSTKGTTCRKSYPSLRRPQQQNIREIYSSTRWIKKAGNQESKSVQKLIECLRKSPPRSLPKEGPHFHITDYSPMFAPVPREPYYDFQIHPEWHQPWHKKYESSTQA
uniref:Uncharacterized LOC100176287 n=1 Tax=Ciona intestinalis TaxID=7719 RepID=F6TMJ1_CIOIN|nr:uncharacterized protein LOC100176287 isoform X1 [Ciona intestinalis]|eukprot:XP_002128279.1 uncharacterized protein LOC100176287 isoform X1 [Ciona intestinalis]